MSVLETGYLRACKDSVAGIKKVWLASYIKYQRKQIHISQGQLLKFPEKQVYYNFNTLFNASASQSMSVDGKGEVYNQSLSISFSKLDSLFFDDLVKGYLQAIVLDNNNKYHILGLFNGLEVTNYTKQTGAGKSELSGYNLTLSGVESVSFPTFESLPYFETATDNELFLASSSIIASTGILSSTIIL